MAYGPESSNHVYQPFSYPLARFSLEELNKIPLDRQMPSDSLHRALQVFTEILSPENLAKIDQPVSRNVELEYYKKIGTKFWSEITFTLI